MLLHRTPVATADEDSGVPRRPARDCDHRRCRAPQRTQGRRQGHRQGEAGGLRCRRRSTRLPRSAGATRRGQAQRHRDGHRRRRVRRSNRGDGRQQGTLRGRHQGAHAGGSDPRCRRVPRAVGRWRVEARNGEGHGAASDHPGARESDARDHAGHREGGAAGRGDRHRTLGFPEPGEQRTVFPVHLPRGTRRRRHHHHRRDEARSGSRDCRSGDGGAIRDRRQCLQPGRSAFRARVPDPETVRSAPHRADCTGGGPGGHGQRRRDPAHQGLRGLSRTVDELRVPLRTHHAAGVRGGETQPEARRVRRGRRRACAARRAGNRRRRPRQADSRRAPPK